MRVRLSIQLCFSAVVAMLVAVCAVLSVNQNGPFNLDDPPGVVIRERNAMFIIPPEWIHGSDTFDVLFAWGLAETRARLMLVGLIWVLAACAMIWRDLRRRRRVLA